MLRRTIAIGSRCRSKLAVVSVCALGLVSGCQRAADTNEPAANAVNTAATPEAQRAEWIKLVEQARREDWSRIESDLALSDDDVAQLAGMKKMREIKLPRAAVSDQALEAIDSLSTLEVLVLGDTTVTDRGLAKLGGMQSLRDLNLNESRVTDAGLAHLTGLARLELLRLGKSQVTDDGLASIGRITSLRFLILQNARITGRGFRHLHGLKNLESLYLQGNPLTGEGVADLRRALPGLHPDW